MVKDKTRLIWRDIHDELPTCVNQRPAVDRPADHPGPSILGLGGIPGAAQNQLAVVVAEGQLCALSEDRGTCYMYHGGLE